MSSATSIDRAGAAQVGTGSSESPKARPRDVFKPWHFFVLTSLLAATVAVILARQSRPEHLILISVTIGAAGFAAGALYRTLAPLVGTDVADAAAAAPLADSRRAFLEREKALVLRSIKELEFDRAMGKVSPKDFDDMAGRLRSRAISLMRQLDAEAGYREMIERDLKTRLAARAQRPAPRRDSHAAAAAARCACGTVNDPDAAFCKRCGSKLHAAR